MVLKCCPISESALPWFAIMIPAPITDTQGSPLECRAEEAVMQTLAYFEAFSYPLTGAEVYSFCCEADLSPADVFEQLQLLVTQAKIFQFGAFFQSKNEPIWVTRRLEYNKRAEEFLPLAKRMSRFIAAFPFVRGVFVSGSLSKHCMRPDSDVDFFIVTSPGRLWLARTLLVMFKKVFLFNSHKYFCINYFVDTEHLEIEEKNRFTAIESVTLLPMWGGDYYEAFYRANTWAWQFYPHFSRRSTRAVLPYSSSIFKNILEKVFKGKLGGWLDQKAMQITIAFWKRKFKHLNQAAFDLALKSRPGISKHHPLHFQEKVLRRFEENLKALKSKR